MNATLHRIHSMARGFECGLDGRMHLLHLCNHLQDAADAHARALGVGMQDLLDQNLAWLLTHLRLDIRRLPQYGQELDLITWPTGSNRLYAWRQFLMKTAGQTLLRGASAWVVLDIAKHSLARMPEGVKQVVPPAETPEPLPLEEPPNQDQEEGDACETCCDTPWEGRSVLHARLSDTDANGHVNNAVLCQWLMEAALPEMTTRGAVLEELDVRFKAEIAPGERAVSEVHIYNRPVPGASAHSQEGQRFVCLHTLQRGADDALLVAGRSCWREE